MEKLYGKQLEIMATKARLLGLDAVHTAASGHIGGSLSAMDILTTLYFNVMQVDPANPQDPDRDRFVLSKGHCTPALYPVLSLRGFFPQEDLKLFLDVFTEYFGSYFFRYSASDLAFTFFSDFTSIGMISAPRCTIKSTSAILPEAQ